MAWNISIESSDEECHWKGNALRFDAVIVFCTAWEKWAAFPLTFSPLDLHSDITNFLSKVYFKLRQDTKLKLIIYTALDRRKSWRHYPHLRQALLCQLSATILTPSPLNSHTLRLQTVEKITSVLVRGVQIVHYCTWICDFFLCTVLQLSIKVEQILKGRFYLFNFF